MQAEYPIEKPEDWRRLRPWRGTEGEYLVVLEAQRIALSENTGASPPHPDGFQPADDRAEARGAREATAPSSRGPSAVHAGLEIIAETTRRFAAEVVTRGADGLFFASQTANEGYLTRAEYAEFAETV